PDDVGARVVTYYAPIRGELFDYWSDWKKAFDEFGNEIGDKLGDLGAIVDEVHTRNPDPERALAEIHRWFQTQVRSIYEPSWREQHDGHPGWNAVKRDYSINALLRRGWGDDYQINAAFAAAARRLGFEACVALTGDRDRGSFDLEVMGYPPDNAVTAVRPK